MMRSDTTVNKVVFKEVPVEVEKIEEEIVWKDRRVEVQVPVEKVVERERVVYNDVVEYRDKVVYKDHIGAPCPQFGRSPQARKFVSSVSPMRCGD